MTKIIMTSIMILLLSGCAKQEVKTNFHNVKDGVKRDWNSARKSVSESTEEFKNGSNK